MRTEMTIRDWLCALPYPYRNQALANANHLTLNVTATTFRDALLGAFNWQSSTEGSDYWEKVSWGEYERPQPLNLATSTPTIKDGGPVSTLTKREYFAALAMQGLLANDEVALLPHKLAERSIEAADKLVGLLSQPTPTKH
jgi:hypothetical protein